MNLLDKQTNNSLIDVLADDNITKTDMIRQLLKQETIKYQNMVDRANEEDEILNEIKKDAVEIKKDKLQKAEDTDNSIKEEQEHKYKIERALSQYISNTLLDEDDIEYKYNLIQKYKRKLKYNESGICINYEEIIKSYKKEIEENERDKNSKDTK